LPLSALPKPSPNPLSIPGDDGSLILSLWRHLGIDPFAYLRDTLPGLFALGEKPTGEQLADRLPDRWLLRRMQESIAPAAG